MTKQCMIGFAQHLTLIKPNHCDSVCLLREQGHEAYTKTLTIVTGMFCWPVWPCHPSGYTAQASPKGHPHHWPSAFSGPHWTCTVCCTFIMWHGSMQLYKCCSRTMQQIGILREVHSAHMLQACAYAKLCIRHDHAYIVVFNLIVCRLLAFCLLLPFVYLLQPSPQELQQDDWLGCLQTSSSVGCSVYSTSSIRSMQHKGVCWVA